MHILTFMDWYLPAYKAGGPVRTLFNVVSSMPEEFRFWILTGDRDLGDSEPYPNVALNRWTKIGGANVFYNRSTPLDFMLLRSLHRDIKPDVVYLNSLFSRRTIRYLIARRMRLIPHCPVIVAPRGELAPSALGFKPRRKYIFRRLGLTTGLFSGVTWQASTQTEAEDIRRALLRRAGDIHVAMNVSVAGDVARLEHVSVPERSPKQTGSCDFVYLARITPIKNLRFAIEVLAAAKGSRLFVYGPIENAKYWKDCIKLAEQLGLSLTYGGAVKTDDVPSTIARHQVYILPTLGENFGHTIVEALSAGVPALISDQTPWRSLKATGAGWDLPLDDKEAWMGPIRRCIAMTNEELIDLQGRARAFALSASQPNLAIEQNVHMFRTAAASR